MDCNCGAGRVGKDIARELRNEKKFDVVLIDSDSTSVKMLNLWMH